MRFVNANMKRRILAGETPTWILKHKRRDYILRAFLSAPLWIKQKDFADLHRRAKEISKHFGPHSLDHIIPISHPYVCGLSVPWNIQVITHKHNVSKGNKWHPDQESFVFEVQLVLW